jgi:hypothetical protein
LSLMLSSSSQPRLRTLPHRCRRDCRRPPTERPHSRRAILAGAVVIVFVVVAPIVATRCRRHLDSIVASLCAVALSSSSSPVAPLP